MLKQLKIQQGSKGSISHEDLFVERYDRLMSQALHLTEGDKQQAEDLLHDAFIQFTLTRPDLEAITKTEGYLFVTLRNLRLSQVRRAAYSTRLTSLASYDSFEFGLRARDLRAQIRVQDELHAICEYATLRKESSKAGSVLILRFFHGYYPSETALILRTPRRVVDNWLGIARREAKLYLDNPESLAFISGSAAEPLPARTPAFPARVGLVQGMSTPGDPFQNFQIRIFNSVKGECFSREQLATLYAPENESPTSCPQLAHLVSCATCLDEVNQILRIPSLSERNPFDVSGRDDRVKGGPGGPQGSGGSPSVTAEGATFARRSQRDAKVTFEHRPEELRFSANGFVVGSLKIESERSEQTIGINLDEQISFVEVFSEQGVRLLLMNIEPPPVGSATQSLKVLLSDNRSLLLSLAFSDHWPTLQTVYFDPLLSDASLPLDEPAIEQVGAQRVVPQAEHKRQDQQLGLSQADTQPEQARVFADGDSTRLRGSVSPRISHLLLSALSGLWLKPATATVLVASLLLGAIAFFRTRVPSIAPSAEGLLAQAIAREQELTARADTVIHQTVTLEERSVGSQSVLARRRIDIWRSAQLGITARRFYDEKGNLIAGDWRRGDGAQTLYHHGANPELRPPPSDGAAGKLGSTFDAAWRLSLSAKDFSALFGGNVQPRVDEKPNLYVIAYDSVVGAGNAGAHASRSADRAGTDSADIYKGHVVRGTLVLNRADLHPIEQTLVIRQGDETREYHFIETAFETRLPSTVAPAVFEPDPILLSDATTGKAGERAISPSSLPLAPSPVVATPALEVEVLRLLEDINADMGQEVSVKREADGALHVEAIVEAGNRKSEILSALAPVAGNAALKIRIETTAEAQARIRRERSSPKVEGETSEFSEETPVANAIPVDQELRHYFQSKGVSGRQLDDEISHLSNRMLNLSHQAMLHAFAMKNLVGRFSQEDLRSLDPTARQKFRSMIAVHAIKFQQDANAIHQELAPIFGAVASSASSEEGVSVTDDASLFRAALRLAQLASQMNEAIQSGFTISSGNRNAVVRSQQFWRSLKSAQSVAAILVSNNGPGRQ